MDLIRRPSLWVFLFLIAAASGVSPGRADDAIPSGVPLESTDAQGAQARSYLKKDADGWRRVTRSLRGQPVRHESTSEPAVKAPTADSGLFRPYVNRETGSWPEAVAIGDLNGDGRNDVALVTSYYFDPPNDYMLHLFLQDAAGGLAPAVKYPVGQTPKSVDVGDVTGDGRADVVTSTWPGVCVLRQNVQGTLDPIVCYPNPYSPYSYMVKIGDFNSDGRGDVVCICSDAAVAVFLQNAGGTLDPPVLYSVGLGGSEVEVGDVNADGRDDIVVMSGQGFVPNLGLLIQNPAGGFAPVVYYDLGGNELTRGAEVSDVTGDDREDVVVTYGGNGPSAHIAVFQQNAGGTLNPPYSLPSYDIPEPIESADLDDDGRNDAAVLHGGWMAMGVYLQGTSGVLGTEMLEPIPYASHYNSQGLALGDIDGDGEKDAVIADYNYGLVVLYHKAAHDLSLVITDAPDPVPVGSNVTYTLTVTNSGTSPMTGIGLTDTLPAGLTYVSSTPPGACAPAGSMVTCALGDLLRGAVKVATIVATANAAGAYVNQATAAANEPDDLPADNTATASTQFFIPCNQLLSDGGFELGSPNPFWGEYSTNFGTPLCTQGYCGTGGGTAYQHSGIWWAWFGGIDVFEEGVLTQGLTIPQGSATVRFYLLIGARSGNGIDNLRVLVDGIPVFTVMEWTPGYTVYSLVQVDVSAFADGGSHLLTFYSQTFGPEVTNFSVDDVTMDWCPLPTLSVDDVTVTEGDSGSVGATFTVSLSQSATNTVTVDYGTGPPASGNPATPGLDYTPASGTLSFTPGSLTRTVTVAVLGDLEQEATETFGLGLSSPTNATIADGQGLGTILDDNDPPEVSIGDCAAMEGDAGTVPCGFTVSLSTPSIYTVGVSYVTANGTATADSDYTAAAGALSFPPGTTSQPVSVQVLGDILIEPDESFYVNLTGPTNGTLGDAQGQGTIGDDDAPSLSSHEVHHGSVQRGDLLTRPDLYRIGQKPYSSYEVVIDETSGDIVPVALQRLAGDNVTVLQNAAPVAVGDSVSLRWENTTSLTVVNQHLRVDGLCNPSCGPDDVYRLRAVETTYSIPRFNNAGSQVTVLVLQNPAPYAVTGHIWFWDTAGAFLETQGFSLPPKQTLVLNTANVPGLAGHGGSITISHDGRYGDLTGKTVALEPSTGYSFDSPMTARPR